MLRRIQVAKYPICELYVGCSGIHAHTGRSVVASFVITKRRKVSTRVDRARLRSSVDIFDEEEKRAGLGGIETGSGDGRGGDGGTTWGRAGV